jgi:hypothetical protein
MQKGKILVLDDLTVELFMGFYNMMKEDLLKVVQESQSSSKVLGALNSTFLVLIRKKKMCSLSTILGLSPVAMSYTKLIAKIIVQRSKPIFSDIISKE